MKAYGFIFSILLCILPLTATAATITVTNTNDSGAGSLRQAIADAAPGDTINFSVTGTITLTSGQLTIDKNLTIQGPGANLLSVSGNHSSRVFSVIGNVVLDGMTIRDGNSSNSGGGIDNYGTLIVNNCTISGNTVAGGSLDNNGGGIQNSATLTVSNCTIAGNHVYGYYDGNGDLWPGYGGGISNDGINFTGETTVTNSTISGNTADNGGGIYNEGTITVTNSTISGNTATNRASGILGFDNPFSGDHSAETLRNTIVAGNGGSDIDAMIETASHNLIGDAVWSGGIVNGVNGNIVGVNPMLGPLADNGGPTMTHALLAGSPAINAGDNCVLTDNGCGFTHPALPTDQRSMPRSGNVDIGAFELQGQGPEPTPTPSPTPTPTVTPSPALSTIKVTNTKDSGAGSLRQAIADAAAGDTINFDASVFSTPQTITLTSGQLVIDKNLNIQGPGANQLSISGNHSSRVFYISSGVITLEGIAIKDGSAGNDAGGGIFNVGDLTIISSSISGSSATCGGGIYSSPDTLAIVSSTVSGNTAVGEFEGCSGGGGIFNSGLTTLTNSVISGNNASYYFGGGISNEGTLTVNDSTISGNICGFGGGGIYSHGISSTTMIVNSTISGNEAGLDIASSTYGGRGGGIFHESGMLSVNNSTFAHNVANLGGGIYNISTLIVSNNTISGNTATYDSVGRTGSGGGIFNAGMLTIIDSTVSDNLAEWFYGSDASSAVGGISSGGTEQLKNSIVARNTSYSTNADISGSIDTASHNLIGDAASAGGIQNGVNGNIVGVDPLLGPLQNNGGTTMTHALLTGSPAIDAGDNCVLTVNGCGDNNPALDADQTGYPRDGLVDIGAYEFRLTTAATVKVGGRVTTSSGGGIRKAIVTMTDATTGTTRTVKAKPSGAYSFKGITAGQSYLFQVTALGYKFEPQFLTVTGDVTDLNFIGQ